MCQDVCQENVSKCQENFMHEGYDLTDKGSSIDRCQG